MTIKYTQKGVFPGGNFKLIFTKKTIKEFFKGNTSPKPYHIT